MQTIEIITGFIDTNDASYIHSKVVLVYSIRSLGNTTSTLHSIGYVLNISIVFVTYVLKIIRYFTQIRTERNYR